MENTFTGTIEQGLNLEKVIGTEVCIGDGKKGKVLEYDPETGEITIQVSKTVHEALLEKMGQKICVSSRCIHEIGK